jgi:hypothetical protein
MKEELTSQTTTNKPPVLATVMFGTMVRLLVGAGVWSVLLLLLLAGGGNELFQIIVLVTLLIPLWVLWPIGKYAYFLISKKASNDL